MKKTVRRTIAAVIIAFSIVGCTEKSDQVNETEELYTVDKEDYKPPKNG